MIKIQNPDKTIAKRNQPMLKKWIVNQSENRSSGWSENDKFTNSDHLKRQPPQTHNYPEHGKCDCYKYCKNNRNLKSEKSIEKLENHIQMFEYLNDNNKGSQLSSSNRFKCQDIIDKSSDNNPKCQDDNKTLITNKKTKRTKCK